MQASTTYSDHPEVESLFRLVTSHLECPMGALTLHASRSDRPDILALFNMNPALASQIALSIQRAVGFDNWLPDAAGASGIDVNVEQEQRADSSGHIFRLSFLCRVEPTIFLSLSCCRPSVRPETSSPPEAGEIRGWVETHLRLLWQAHRDRNRAASLGQALDLFDFATILLDTDGNILFANEQARNLLDAGEGLRRAGQSLTATDFDNAVRLQATIQHFNHGTDQPAMSDAGRVSVMLLRRSSARPLVAALSRISNGETHAGGAATVLHVLDPDTDTHSLVAALCRAYGLTATEAGLVIRLVEGLRIEAAARDMRIQTQTARAYLKQVFAKTDTHRQADLVRVILSSVVRIRATAMPPSNGGNGSSRLGAERLPVWG